MTPDKDALLRMSKLIPGLGLMMAFFSGCVFCTAAFAIEKIPDVDPTCSVVYRSLMQLIVYGAVAIVQGEPLLGIPSERIFVTTRASAGFVGFTTGYYAFRFMTFSNVNTITMSSPVYVAPFAYFFLREPCGLYQILLIATTLIGIVLITRPSPLFASFEGAIFTPQENVIGAILAFAAAMGVTGSILSLRLCKKTPASVIIVWFSVSSVILGITLMAILKFVIGLEIVVPTTASHWLWLNVNAICGLIGQAFFVWSLKLEEASVVSLLRTFDIVLSFIFQIAFLNQPIFWTSIVGAVIVCGSVVVICLKRLLESHPDSLNKIRFCRWRA